MSKSNRTETSGSDSPENANSDNADSLRAAKCVPCEGGVPTLSRDQASDLINQISVLAEQEQHHPDLHLTGYRMLTIELTTHAINGLSRNDFVVAAKIDPLLAEQSK